MLVLLMKLKRDNSLIGSVINHRSITILKVKITLVVSVLAMLLLTFKKMKKYIKLRIKSVKPCGKKSGKICKLDK